MIAASMAALVIASAVVVDRREVTVGDLVRTADGRRFAGRGAALVALRLPPARTRMMLSAASVAALVRRQLPSLTVAAAAGPVAIALRGASAPDRRCWASARAMAAGAAVTLRDVVAVPCDGRGVAAIAADPRDRVPVLVAAQPAGTPLGRFLPAPSDRIGSGTALTLRSVRGPVAIERSVTTMQPGRSGRRVFVRDGAGRVFAAPLALAEDAR